MRVAERSLAAAHRFSYPVRAMAAIATLTGPLPKLGVIAVAMLGAWCMLATRSRSRAIAMLGAILLAPTLVLAEIWHSPQCGIL